jgi:zinc protease
MHKLLSLLLLPAALFAQGTPTAEQILDRYIEVTGGKAAYARLTSEVTHSVMEMKSQGLQGKGTTYRDAKGNSYNSLELTGVGTVEEGYYQGIAWENSAIQGPRIKTGEERAFFARESILGKDLQWRKLYSRAVLEGEETVTGVPCYKIVLTPNNEGKAETRFYEKQSGLLRKNSMILSNPMGEIPAETYMTDYKTFSGLKVPTNILTKIGPQDIHLTITNVTYNQAIPESRLRPPTEILELAKKQNSSKK